MYSALHTVRNLSGHWPEWFASRGETVAQSRRPLVAIVALGFVLAACTSGGASNEPSSSAASEAPASAEPSEPTAWEPEFVDGVLQPLPDGFPNQPIQIVVQAEAGDDDGIYSRVFAEAASAISPVPINPVDRPDLGNQWELVNWISEQPGGTDGSILGVVAFPAMVMDILVLDVEGEYGLTIDDLDVLSMTEHVPWVMVSRPDAPWGSDLEAMVQYAKDNPGELRALTRGPDSGTTIAFYDFARTMGFEFQDIPGGDSQEVALNIAASQGDAAVSLMAINQPLIEGGRSIYLSCSGVQDPCPEIEGADQVTPWALVAGEEISIWGSNRSLLIDSDAPPEHRAWMDALVQAVIATDEFKAGREGVPGLILTNGTSEDALAMMRLAYERAYPIVGDLGVRREDAPAPEDL
jgi:tripartite-type tricarboxylate transporter receptor subunit TctC